SLFCVYSTLYRPAAILFSAPTALMRGISNRWKAGARLRILLEQELRAVFARTNLVCSLPEMKGCCTAPGSP
ncbi:MAG: hypothetical protein ACK559_37550, partial [bacterium]